MDTLGIGMIIFCIAVWFYCIPYRIVGDAPRFFPRLIIFFILIPSILFVLVVCYYLGVRNIWILVILPVGLSGFLSIVFKVFIKVPIPIWPW